MFCGQKPYEIYEHEIVQKIPVCTVILNHFNDVFDNAHLDVIPSQNMYLLLLSFCRIALRSTGAMTYKHFQKAGWSSLAWLVRSLKPRETCRVFKAPKFTIDFRLFQNRLKNPSPERNYIGSETREVQKSILFAGNRSINTLQIGILKYRLIDL